MVYSKSREHPLQLVPIRTRPNPSMAETIRSPLRESAEDSSLPPPPPPPLSKNASDYQAADGEPQPQPPPATAISTQFDFAAEAVAKAELGGAGAHWYSWSGQRAEAGASRSVDAIMRRGRQSEAVQHAAVAARVAAAVLCLVSFSVMAADKNKGWGVDDYNRYKQFRYSVSVNVIGFLYSSFQVYATVHHLMKEKHICRPSVRNYFNFAMDQILAYLLISSSSAATARVGDWVSNWGRDPFPNMANGSVAVSFLAFFALAISSLISSYDLFSGSL